MVRVHFLRRRRFPLL